MKLNILITEAESLIKEKSGKDVSLQIIDEKTIQVGYKLKTKVPLLGELSKDVIIDLTIDKLTDETLYLTYAAKGNGMEFVLKGLLAALPTFSKQQLIENDGNNSLIVHLNEIPQIHNALQFIEINTFQFKNDMIIIDFDVK